MAENTENINLVIQIVDSGIDIKLPWWRSTHLIKSNLAFFTNSYLSNALINIPQGFVTSSSFVVFHPPIQTLWMFQITQIFTS
jgi:hypothetical protein